MKKQLLFIAVIIATSFGFSARAQVSVNVNIGTQPVWGPVGYDYVQYYYIPDIDAYYDVDHRTYIYMDGPRWVTRRYLPVRYRNYDLYRGYKVVVNEPTPWMHHDRYRTRYITYRNRHDQPYIRESRDERYYVNPHHPQHSVWQKSHGPVTQAPVQVRQGRRPGAPAEVRRPGAEPGRGNNGPRQIGGPAHAPGNGPGNGHGNGRGHEDHGGGHGRR